MSHTVRIDADTASTPDTPFGAFLLYGGDPAGRDEVHQTVSRWRGWRRLPKVARTPHGTPCSIFRASALPTSLEPLLKSDLRLEWTTPAAWLRESVLARGAMLASYASGGLPPHPRKLPTARRPLPHQEHALAALKLLGYRALLADDMGLGKTATALWAAHDSGAVRLAIVCPVSVKFNWQNELAATLGERWVSIVIDGDRRARADCFAELAAWTKGGAEGPGGRKVAVILNYDLLRHLNQQQQEQLQLFTKGEFVICDESHAIKSRTAERTKLVRALFADSLYRLCLSGTPVRNTVEDLYSQVEFVRPHTWTSYAEFEKRHLVTARVDFGKRPVQKVVGSKNVDELNGVVKTLMVRRHKTDVLDLPPKTFTYPELELDDVTRKVYEAMKGFAKLRLAELAPGTSVFDPRAQSAVEAAMRCEQIAQGFVGGVPEPLMSKLTPAILKHAVKIKGRPNELLFPQAPKIQWLLESIDTILAQNGKPVVFSRFNAPMQWLCEHLRLGDLRVSWIHGALTAVQKQEEIERFQKGESEVFLCQVMMAEGFNLVQSQDVLFLGRAWSPAVNVQAEDRCHRIGQTGTVNIQVPIVLKTIEWPIHKRLLAKASTADQALTTIQELQDAL